MSGRVEAPIFIDGDVSRRITSRLALGFLSSSRASTTTYSLPSRTSVVSLRFLLKSTGRSDQVTSCSQNLAYMGELAQSRSQPGLLGVVSASLVKATPLPRPYCQYARIGQGLSPILGVMIGSCTS